MPEQVGQICAAIPGGRERRLELLLAWLRDCAEVGKIAGIDDRHFILGPAQDVPGYAGTLSAELELIARESVAHEDIRAAVSELARMLRRHHAELADARATVLPFSAPSKPAPGVVVSPEVADKIPGALAAVAKAKRNFHA